MFLSFLFLYGVLLLLIPALMILVIIRIINNTDSDLSEYIRENLKIVLLSWAMSAVLLRIYRYLYTDSLPESSMFSEVVIMGYFVFVVFILLYILSYVRKSLHWSVRTDFICKIFFTVLFYIPVNELLSYSDMLKSFTCWSLGGTIAVIVFNYRHLLSGKSVQLSEKNHHQR